MIVVLINDFHFLLQCVSASVFANLNALALISTSASTSTYFSTPPSLPGSQTILHAMTLPPVLRP